MPAKPNLQSVDNTPHKTQWQLWEADILVDCGLKHQFITVFLPNTGEVHQTFLHGFDLDNSQLLLDGLYPWPQQVLIKNDSLWLQIRSKQGFFNIQAQLIESEGHHGSEYLTVKVRHTELTHNRRWHPRVYFAQNQGPSVDLQLPDHAIIKAHVANLSARGALLEIFGKDIKTRGNRSFYGRFVFNEQFNLNLYGSIRQIRFLRTPCCHTQVRIQFQRMNADQQVQLDTFIQASGLPMPEYTQSLAAAC